MPTRRREAVREITGVRMGHYGSTYPPDDEEDAESNNRARLEFVVKLLTDLGHYCEVFDIDKYAAASSAYDRQRREI